MAGADAGGAGGGEPFQPQRVLETLLAHGVDFVVVGGLAGTAHGSSYPTYDTDIAYARDRDNLERLAAALREMEASLRGAPADLPFQRDARTLANGMNFTLETKLGVLDLLGEAAGMGRYDTLRAEAVEVTIGGVTVRVASLDRLISMKRAAGRPKDRLMIGELIDLIEEAES